MNAAERGKDFLAALSLANLSFIAIWDPLLNYTRAQAFMLNHAPPRAAYAAAFVNVGLLTILFFVLIRISRFAARRFGVAGGLIVAIPFLVAVSLPAKSIIRMIIDRDKDLGQGTVAAILIAVLFLIAAFTRRRFFVFLTAVLVTISPLVAIETIVSISKCRADPLRLNSAVPLASRNPPGSRPRIVWIIFDELDYRLAFVDRAANAPLPEFDRLRAHSLFGENVASPGPDTIPSIPSLITGVPADNQDMQTFSQPTIFESAHAIGANVSVTGWYVPYCRMPFASSLAACTFHELENEITGFGLTFGENLIAQQKSLISFGNHSLWGRSTRAAYRIEMIDRMHEESLRNVADPTLDFVFLHLPVPHPPYLYDRFQYQFRDRILSSGSYWDNLALADNFLGDIRQAMTDANLWDSSTVLVTSDHPLRTSTFVDRKSDWRIPFLLKLPNQTTGATYGQRFNSVVTKSLFEAILRGEIKTAAGATSWLDKTAQVPIHSLNRLK